MSLITNIIGLIFFHLNVSDECFIDNIYKYKHDETNTESRNRHLLFLIFESGFLANTQIIFSIWCKG